MIRNQLSGVAGILLALCLFGARFGWSHEQLPPSSSEAADAETVQRKQLLAQMRKRAEGTKAFRLRMDDKEPIGLLTEPMVRYSDPPREIADATLWAFGEATLAEGF